ncbi:Uncharacterised protein [Enterobacter hormaechei]|nr:Uncharacterised protein [Enterobacter hormaechei]
MVAVNILAGIIRFNPVDFVIANVQTQGAAAAALFRPKGNAIPPAASAKDPMAVDLTRVRRLIPP